MLHSGEEGWKDGPLSSAQFSNCTAIACFLKTGDLYVADRGNNVIRKISPNGTVLMVRATCRRVYCAVPHLGHSGS